MSNDWKEVVASDTPAWDKKTTLEGVLVSKKEKVGPNESMLYTLKTDKGEIGVWGSAVLDTKFAEIPAGFSVRVEPLGLTKSPKSGREYNDFKVMYKPFDGWEAGKTYEFDADQSKEVAEEVTIEELNEIFPE